MLKKDERYEIRKQAVRFERLTNSRSGNASWEVGFTDGVRRRTAEDSQVGAEVTALVDGLLESDTEGGRTIPREPLPVVMVVDGYNKLRELRLDEEGQR